MQCRLRLYESALNDVRYHHGAPLRFDPKLAEDRRDNWMLAVYEWEARQARKYTGNEGIRD